MSNKTRWRMYLDDDADTTRRPEISVENPSWRRNANLPLYPPILQDLGDWIIVRNYKEAIAAIDALGFPTYVSFDHDIASEETGLDVVKYLIELDLDTNTMPEDFRYEVHSANPIGRENINGLLKPYMSQKEWIVPKL